MSESKINKKQLALAGLVGGGYLLFKGLQLRQTAKDILINIKSVQFDVNKRELSLSIVPVVEIINPVGGSITISNIYGNLVDAQGYQYGTFQSGRFTLQRSTTLVKLPIRITNFTAIPGIIDAIQNNRWPKFTMNYTISMVGGVVPIKNKITFDTSVIQRAINWK